MRSVTRNMLIVIACLLGLPFSGAEPPTRQTRHHDSIDTLSRAAGDGGTPLSGGESVSPLNGNLEVTHPVSLHVPIDAGGGFGLTRTYNSHRVALELITQPSLLTNSRLTGQSWIGLGWTMHLGRIATMALWNENDREYGHRQTFFETPTGTQIRVSPNSREAHPNIRVTFHAATSWSPPSCCTATTQKCQDSPLCDPELAPPNEPAYYKAVFPDGTTYRLEERVSERLGQSSGYVLNHDRSGYYPVSITDVFGNEILIEYHDGGPFPEAISRISYARDGSREITTTIWSQADAESSACPQSAVGMLKRVTSKGFQGTERTNPQTVYTDFFYTDYILNDDYDGTIHVALLDHVTTSGVGVEAQTITYGYGGQREEASAPAVAPLLDQISYPLGASVHYKYREFAWGLRQGAPPTPRAVIGVGERDVVVNESAVVTNHARWHWTHEFATSTCQATKPPTPPTSAAFTCRVQGPTGLIEEISFNGEPCGREWDTWGSFGSPRRMIVRSGDGSALRTVDYDYDSTQESEDGEIIHTLVRRETTTFGDDDGSCFDETAGPGTQQMTELWEDRDPLGYWKKHTLVNGDGISGATESLGYFSNRGIKQETVTDYDGTSGCRYERHIYGAYTSVQLTEGSRTTKTPVTFDCNGRLETAKLRDDWAAADALSDDGTVTYGYDPYGNQSTLTWSGGQNYAGGGSANAYSVAIGQQFGVEASRTVALSPGQNLSLESHTIDRWTGHAAAASSPSGFTVRYDRDALGRLTSVTPSSEESATAFRYIGMSSTGVREVRSISPPADAYEGSNLAQLYLASRLDARGRVIEQRRAMPWGLAVRFLRYDELDRVVFESEWLQDGSSETAACIEWQVDRDNSGAADYTITGVPCTTAGTPWGTAYFYGTPKSGPMNPLDLLEPDGLGRVRRVVRPDGSIVDMEYCGPHQQVAVRNAKVDADGDGTSVTQDIVTRTYRDALGRVVLVDGPASGVDAEYTYYPNGALETVNLVANLPENPFAAWKSAPIPDGQVGGSSRTPSDA